MNDAVGGRTAQAGGTSSPARMGTSCPESFVRPASMPGDRAKEGDEYHGEIVVSPRGQPRGGEVMAALCLGSN